MSGEDNVARGGAQEGETALEAMEQLGVIGEAKAIGGDGREAIGVNQVEAAARFAGFPGPTGAAGSMARSEMSGELERSDAEDFAVVKRFDVGDGRDTANDAVLWIVGGDAAFFQNGSTPFTGGDAGAAQTLQLGDASGMIEVNVRIDDELHVFDAKAESAKVGDNMRDGFGKVGVEEHMTGIRGDENGGETVRADVISVAEDAEWHLRRIPFGAAGAGRSLLGASGMPQNGQQREGKGTPTNDSEECDLHP